MNLSAYTAQLRYDNVDLLALAATTLWTALNVFGFCRALIWPRLQTGQAQTGTDSASDGRYDRSLAKASHEG